MSNNKQQGSLSEKFQGFGAAPSDALWGSIAAAVDEKKSRKGIFWWWLGSGLAASFLLVYLSFNFFGSDNNLANIHTSENHASSYRTKTENKGQLIHSSSNELNDSVISINEIQFNNKEQLDKNQFDQEKSSDLIINPLDFENQSIEKLDHSIAKNDLFEQGENVDDKHVNLESDSDEEVYVEKLNTSKIDLLAVEVDYPQILNTDVIKKTSHKPWELGFNLAYYADVNLSFVSKKQEVYPTTSADFSESAFISGTQPDVINTTQGLLPPASNVIPSTQSSVSRNLNLDFYAGKYLSKRWMFNTGLGFTRSSYKTIYNNGFLLTQLTNISALIVPIGVSFDAVKLPKFKLRTALAFNNEFAFYERFGSEAPSPSYNPKGFIKGYSASLELALGHVFQLRPRMALNVAPSFRYYLSQNIQSQNYLIKRNQWIGGKIGMIWTL